MNSETYLLHLCTILLILWLKCSTLFLRDTVQEQAVLTKSLVEERRKEKLFFLNNITGEEISRDTYILESTPMKL